MEKNIINRAAWKTLFFCGPRGEAGADCFTDVSNPGKTPCGQRALGFGLGLPLRLRFSGSPRGRRGPMAPGLHVVNISDPDPSFF